MDTVFPEDTDFTWFKENEKHVYGPGVIDMKGGLVAGIYALKALSSIRMLKKIPLTFVFNSDEKIGSPTSMRIIGREARRSAFVLECGGINGGIVTDRKVKLGFTVTVKSKASHAASAGHEKSSAILELSHKIVALEALNNPDKDLSVNVGTIKGGISSNMVADHAVASVDIRFRDVSDTNNVIKQVKKIAHEVSVRGTRTKIDPASERPPMEQTRNNKSLYRVAMDVANNLGIAVVEEFRSGVSDANLIAGQKTAVIDGLGPVGERDHSAEEFMFKDSLKERAQLFALLLLESWRLYKHGALF